MTGAVTLAALVGLASLLAGVALGWYLRRTNDWCVHCGEQLSCDSCGSRAGWPRPSANATTQNSPVDAALWPRPRAAAEETRRHTAA